MVKAALGLLAGMFFLAGCATTTPVAVTNPSSQPATVVTPGGATTVPPGGTKTVQ